MESIKKMAERITLVHATEAHAELLHKIFTGANTRKYSPVHNQSIGTLAEHLRRTGTGFSEKAPHYRLFGEADGILFGTFIVKNIEWDRRRAEAGFSLLDAWQGRGWGRALVYKALLAVFSEPHIDELWATVSVTNTACNSLMHRLGFTFCGPYHEAFRIQGVPVRQNLYQITREQMPCPDTE